MRKRRWFRIDKDGGAVERVHENDVNQRLHACYNNVEDVINELPEKKNIQTPYALYYYEWYGKDIVGKKEDRHLCPGCGAQITRTMGCDEVIVPSKDGKCLGCFAKEVR